MFGPLRSFTLYKMIFYNGWMLGIPVCDYLDELWVTQFDKKEKQQQCQFTQVVLQWSIQALIWGGAAKLLVCYLEVYGEKHVFVYGASVSSHFSPPAQNRGLFMVVCRGRVGLTAESWPSDKADSLQALTGNGARAEALGWLAWSELGRAGLGAVWHLHRSSERETE